ncbi:MAG TPA: hypothetical protein VNH17_15085 [Streptosporangiaceae bacterium]|nr:hypothetical protein [Streptosporangiaceae bacterium]
MTSLIAVLATISFLAALAVTAARLRLLTIRLGPAPRTTERKDPS